VTGLTLSKEQLAEATARVAAAGLSDKVTLLFCDYRYVCNSSGCTTAKLFQQAHSTLGILQLLKMGC
jgi:cyclopropane fatty-acyl-phospholipid synthase-like methyltransferase